MRIGDTIKFYRVMRNMTQEEASAEIISTSYLSKIENNVVMPSNEVYLLLSKRLNIPETTRQYTDWKEELQLFYALIGQGAFQQAETKRSELQQRLIHIHEPEMMAMFLLFETYYYVRVGQWNEARENIERIDNVQHSITTELRYYYHHVKGHYFNSTQQFQLALSQLKLAEGYLQMRPLSKAEEAQLYNEMSTLYERNYETMDAIHYASKALSIHQASYHLTGSISTLLQLSRYYKRLHYYDKAERLIEEARPLSERLTNDVWRSEVEHVASQVALAQHRLEEALCYVKRAIEWSDRTSVERLLAFYVTLIEIYLQQGEYDQACLWNEKLRQAMEGYRSVEKERFVAHYHFFTQVLLLVDGYDETLIQQVERDVIDYFERVCDYETLISYSCFIAQYCEQNRKYKHATKFWRKCYKHAHRLQR